MRNTAMDMRLMHAAIANLTINSEGLLAASLRLRREFETQDLTVFDDDDRAESALMIHECALQFRLILKTLEKADQQMRGAHDAMHPSGSEARVPQPEPTGQPN